MGLSAQPLHAVTPWAFCKQALEFLAEMKMGRRLADQMQLAELKVESIERYRRIRNSHGRSLEHWQRREKLAEEMLTNTEDAPRRAELSMLLEAAKLMRLRAQDHLLRDEVVFTDAHRGRWEAYKVYYEHGKSINRDDPDGYAEEGMLQESLRQLQFWKSEAARVQKELENSESAIKRQEEALLKSFKQNPALAAQVQERLSRPTHSDEAFFASPKSKDSRTE
jgi:hypothetical protein